MSSLLADLTIQSVTPPSLVTTITQRWCGHRWNFTSGKSTDRPGTNSPVVITGWPAARDRIADALRDAGPGCALMGFSQGATAAAAYAAEAGQTQDRDKLQAPACVIAVSGARVRLHCAPVSVFWRE